MSRKDYEAIAKMLDQLRRSGYQPVTLARVASELCLIFAAGNPRFSVGKFLDAAGVRELFPPADSPGETREEIAADTAAQYGAAC